MGYEISRAERLRGLLEDEKSGKYSSTGTLRHQLDPEHKKREAQLTEQYVGEIGHNPSHSEKQRRFMGADYARAKAGQATETGMSMKQLRDFARKPRGRHK